MKIRKLGQRGVSMIEYAILLGLIVVLAVGFLKGDGMIGSINSIVRNVQMVFDDELKASEARKNFIVDTLPDINKYFENVNTSIEDCTFLQSTYGKDNEAKQKFEEFLKENGTNLAEDYNIQYYGYSKQWGVYRWSTVDIKDVGEGGYIPVIQYSTQTGYYEYYNFKVENKDGNLITNATWSENGQHLKLSYEQAEKLYNDAVAKLPDNAKPK